MQIANWTLQIGDWGPVTSSDLIDRSHFAICIEKYALFN
ncbi:hypothetical protein RBWH47_01514 [Rhodopirellula baltica WH47]|uniref:Uncharacterized protein n=1 Tax=Rhodopirellula baltica WH47 TaxID=991778 RepID=F2AKV0_RHOBT|nr:hypothetical protein RBWH47_01514 [Rhodopirellula baltica WH47]